MAKEIQTKSFGYDAFDLINFAWEKRRILIAITLVAFVVSIIVSLMIKSRFKSTVIVFPTAELSISKTLIETGAGSSNEKDVLTFGNDIEAERLLQILRSEQLTNHIIEKFNLLNYFKIDTLSNKYPHSTIKGILGENIRCRRTEYNSIEIQVIDHNPKIAADIANEIAVYTDTIYHKITNQRSQEAYNMVLNEFKISQSEINYITDSLNKIRAHGITEFTAQSDALSKAYGKALLKKDKEAIKSIEDKLGILQKYGGSYVELSTRLGWEISRISAIKIKLAAAKINLDATISNVFIVDKAVKAEKKDGPKRSLIVLFSSLSAFLLSLLALIIAENIKTRL